MQPLIGEYLPDITVFEYVATKDKTKECPIGPKAIRLPELAQDKKILLVGIVGAFTPICQHSQIPGFLKQYKAFKQKGIDEVWCVSVNDAFVMAAWGEHMKVKDKIRMISDGSAELVKAMEVTLDLTCRGMGLRSDRYVLIADNGLITDFIRENPGEFCKTSAEAVLARL